MVAELFVDRRNLMVRLHGACTKILPPPCGRPAPARKTAAAFAVQSSRRFAGDPFNVLQQFGGSPSAMVRQAKGTKSPRSNARRPGARAAAHSSQRNGRAPSSGARPSFRFFGSGLAGATGSFRRSDRLPASRPSSDTSARPHKEAPPPAAPRCTSAMVPHCTQVAAPHCTKAAALRCTQAA